MLHRRLLVPGKLDLLRYVPLVASCEGMLRSTQPFDSVNVDLSPLTQISATGLAFLAGTMLHLAERRLFRSGRFVRPRDESTHLLLTKLGFYDCIADPVKGFARAAERLRSIGGLVNVRREEDCTAVASQLTEFVCSHTHACADTRSALLFCMPEVLENVFRHAESPIRAVACAQVLPGSGQVEVAIVDTGIGLRESLRRNPSYSRLVTDDTTAIRYALGPEVTSKPGLHSGVGLFFTRKIVISSGGDLLLHSGTGRSYFRGSRLTEETSSVWPGTSVAMRFGLRMPRSLSEIFTRYQTQADLDLEVRL